MNLNDLAMLCARLERKKGFDSTWDKNFAEKMALVMTECCEAIEEHRALKPKWNKVSEEIADAFIRLFAICGALNINIEYFITEKLVKNQEREEKHGKRY